MTYTTLSKSYWMQLGLVALLASQTLGCPDDKEDPPSSNTNQGDMMDMSADAGAQDMGMDATMEEDMSADMPEPDMCEPLTECPMDVCGEVSDGCGGTIQCEPCACVDGTPSTPTCGACGWGITSCESDTGNSDAVCSIGELPAMPGNCEDVIYVSLTANAAGADGSKESPFTTIADAINLLERDGASALVLEAGEYDVFGTFDVQDGVHILGGFKPGFEWDAEGRSKLIITPSPVQGEAFQDVGVNATGISSKTLFMNTDVFVDDAADTNHLYAFYVRDSPGLHIQNSVIDAGKAGTGFNGKTGQDGADGEDGGDAAMTTTVQGRVNQPDPNKQINGADAGIAGLNTFCRDTANGGVGGEGSHVRFEDVNSANGDVTPVSASTGAENIVGLAGGAAGTMSSPDGQDGADGTPGTVGANGVSGSNQGAIERGYWIVERDGTSGEMGTDGTGGSGGGGSYWQVRDANLPDSEPGLSGGGGGAGGCGGEGGTGGGGGATGFGMLLVESTGVVLENVQIQAPDGQDGGSAGQGGRGGLGGQGGNPSTMFSVLRSGTPMLHDHRAGAGGNGANGGDGGEGGGGAGGSSIGIWCEGTQVERGMNVEAAAGDAGVGGVGAELGADGQTIDVENCW